MKRAFARFVSETDQRQASIREATNGFSPNFSLVFLSVLTGLPIDEVFVDPLLYVKFPGDKGHPMNKTHDP